MGRLTVVLPEVTVHESSLEHFAYDGPQAVLEFDDADERRIRLVFPGWQAIRITTVDCFRVNSLFIDGRLVRSLLEVHDSPWLRELSAELSRTDYSATFMDKSRHFIVFLGDNVLEVAAYHFTWSRVSPIDR